MDHQALGVAHIRQMGEHLERIDEALAGFQAAFDAERQDGAAAARQIFLSQRAIRARRQPRIVHPFHAGVRLPGTRATRWPLAQCASMRSFSVSTPWRKRNALNGLIGRPDVPQTFHPRPDDKRDLAERLVELHPVIAGAGLSDHREVPFVPREIPAIDDHAADGRPMAADELRRRMQHDIRAVLDRPAEIRRRESVVDDQRNMMLMRDLRDGFDIEHIHPWIRDRLRVDQLGLGRDGVAEILRIVRNRQIWC